MRVFPGRHKLGEKRLATAGAHKREPADAAPGHGDQALAEGALVEAVGNGKPPALGLVLAGGYRFTGNEEVVQATGAGQAGVEGRIQQVRGVLQQRFHVLLGQKLQKALGADADPIAEQPLEMKFAQADVIGDFF